MGGLVLHDYVFPEFLPYQGTGYSTLLILTLLYQLLQLFSFLVLHLSLPLFNVILQVLLGKLGAMLRGEGSQEEGRVGGQHGRIWAWMYQPDT